MTDAAHSAITECALVEASVDRLDISGATLVDVDITGLRATAVAGRGARLRRVRIAGGRIGTLDLTDAELDEVELRGIRIDYLSLGGGRVADLVVAGCTIGTLDMPQARVSRVAFVDSRADEVDTRGLRAEHLDLRGLEAGSYLDLGVPPRRDAVAAAGRAARARPGGRPRHPGRRLTRAGGGSIPAPRSRVESSGNPHSGTLTQCRTYRQETPWPTRSFRTSPHSRVSRPSGMLHGPSREHTCSTASAPPRSAARGSSRSTLPRRPPPGACTSGTSSATRTRT